MTVILRKIQCEKTMYFKFKTHNKQRLYIYNVKKQCILSLKHTINRGYIYASKSKTTLLCFTIQVSQIRVARRLEINKQVNMTGNATITDYRPAQGTKRKRHSRQTDNGILIETRIQWAKQSVLCLFWNNISENNIDIHITLGTLLPIAQTQASELWQAQSMYIWHMIA